MGLTHGYVHEVAPRLIPRRVRLRRPRTGGISAAATSTLLRLRPKAAQFRWLMRYKCTASGPKSSESPGLGNDAMLVEHFDLRSRLEFRSGDGGLGWRAAFIVNPPRTDTAAGVPFGQHVQLNIGGTADRHGRHLSVAPAWPASDA